MFAVLRNSCHCSKLPLWTSVYICACMCFAVLCSYCLCSLLMFISMLTVCACIMSCTSPQCYYYLSACSLLMLIGLFRYWQCAHVRELYIPQCYYYLFLITQSSVQIRGRGRLLLCMVPLHGSSTNSNSPSLGSSSVYGKIRMGSMPLQGRIQDFSKGVRMVAWASEFCLSYNIHKSSGIQKLIVLLQGRWTEKLWEEIVCNIRSCGVNANSLCHLCRQSTAPT